MTGIPLFPLTSPDTKNKGKNWLTPREFADSFDPPLGYTTVLRWIKRGVLEAENTSLVGKYYMIPVSEVERVQRVRRSKS